MQIYQKVGRLVALYSVFNDARLIEESMRSLLGIVDEYHVYDGRYKGYICTCGSEHDFSCDSTKEAVERFKSETGARVNYREIRAMWEFDKRQVMFDDLALGETGIVIDADELFYGSFEELYGFSGKNRINHEYAGFKAGYMWLFSLEAARDNYIRVHLKTPGLKIVNRELKLNYTFEDYEGIYRAEQVYPLKQARLAHLMGNGLGAGYRPKDRDRARFSYNTILGKGLIAP